MIDNFKNNIDKSINTVIKSFCIDLKKTVNLLTYKNHFLESKNIKIHKYIS